MSAPSFSSFPELPQAGPSRAKDDSDSRRRDRRDEEEQDEHRHRREHKSDKRRHDERDSRKRSKREDSHDERAEKRERSHASKSSRQSGTLASERREAHESGRDGRKRGRDDSAEGRELVPSKPKELAAVQEAAQKQEKSSVTNEVQQWRMESRGDRDNLRYGGLHRGDVPRYYRSTGGRVLGLSSKLRITSETAYTGRDLEIVPWRKYQTPRYTDHLSARHLVGKGVKRLALLPSRGIERVLDDDPFGNADSFVELGKSRSFEEKAAELEHEPGQDYRSVAGKFKPAELPESDDEVFGVGDDEGETPEERIRQRNIDYDRATRSKPKDIKLWLTFVDFQDEVSMATSAFRGNASHTRLMSQVERASACDVKLSILTRALAAEGNGDSEELLLAYMNSAAQLWDSDKLMKTWKKTLKANPTLTGLWIEFVRWRQTNFDTFDVEECVRVYADCLRLLSRGAADAAVAKREQLEQNAAYLFLRCTLMLRQAGYDERALAMWQALLELNFFCPADLAGPAGAETESTWFDRVLRGLEAFWDSGKARIGESGALGWSKSAASTRSSVAPVAEPNSLPEGDPFEHWESRERSLASEYHMPARVTDDVIDADPDPYRAVLFEDVRPVLFFATWPDSRMQLAWAYLAFLGLPLVPPDQPTTSPFHADVFIQSHLLEHDAKMEAFWPARAATSHAPFQILHGEAVEHERTASGRPWSAPFSNVPAAPDTLIPEMPAWFTAIGGADVATLDLDLFRNSHALLRPQMADPFFALSAFSIETAASLSKALKFAKQALGNDRNNLLLWDAYARMERSRGKVTEARKVYVSALSLYRSFAPRDKVDGPLLWRAWAELEWAQGSNELALGVLIGASGALGDGGEPAAIAKGGVALSAAMLLRARAGFNAQLEAAYGPEADQGMLRNRNNVAFCAALLEYLTNGMDAATAFLDGHLFRLEFCGASGSAEHEEAFIMCAKLLHRHMSSPQAKVYQPPKVREFLQRALALFPNDSLLLAMLLDNESRMKIQGHMRSTLDKYTLDSKTVTSEGWLFAIWSELSLDTYGTNPWPARNMFERAVENPRTRASVSLWSLYVEFETRNGEFERAKRLVSRAVREAPWCKELYLKAFRAPLRANFTTDELSQLYSLMLSKRIRVRRDLPDNLGELGLSTAAVTSAGSEPQGQAEVGDLDIMTEIEELFAERQRLMMF